MGSVQTNIINNNNIIYNLYIIYYILYLVFQILPIKFYFNWNQLNIKFI